MGEGVPEREPGGPPYELATYVVAVNQSLAVLSRARASEAELRTVVRLACTTVADNLVRAVREQSAKPDRRPTGRE
ncbi:hypothetical protein [Streptomyces sp. NPDC057616]|uniref:hypothetical protein n=1 Tax=Streptomyces sp. NPDC057616 TaxID=3346183 RepID=UPI0036C7F021